MSYFYFSVLQTPKVPMFNSSVHTPTPLKEILADIGKYSAERTSVCLFRYLHYNHFKHFNPRERVPGISYPRPYSLLMFVCLARVLPG